MKLALYETHRAPPRPVELPWLDVEASLMRAPPVIADPDMRPAFGPHVLRGSSRTAEEVLSITAMTHDFDHLTLDQLGSIAAKVERFQGLIYTTWSDGTPEKSIAIRLVLPCPPLEPHRWRRARSRFLAWLGVADDPQTQDPSRLFYVPCSRPGAPPPTFLRLVGQPFDPNILPGERRITVDDFIALRKSVATKKSKASTPEARARLGAVTAALDAIPYGLPYAERGDIDSTMTSLVGHMIVAWGHDVDTDSILEIMSRSLSCMPEDSQHDHAREKIERFFSKARAADLEVSEERIRQHFKALGRSRTEPYTHEELVYMRETYCDRDNLALLVQAAGSIYSITIDGYQPRGRADMPDVVRSLCPFPEVDYRSASGVTKPARMLLDDYGQHAQALEYSYLQPHSTFDGSTLTVSTARPRAIAPAFDADMDRWIDVLGGAPLREWLAWALHLDQALAALHLHGPPGTGKSLFATALARPWGGPANMEHVFGTFNDCLLSSPIVLADERFPTHPTNANAYKTQEFRELVQCAQHKVHAKFKGISTLRGYVRCIVTTNNKQIFKLANNAHSRDDIAAIHERVLRVPVTEAARAYLRGLDTASIAGTDRFVAHVLTLPRPATSHRFGIAPLPIDYSLVVDLFVPNHVCQIVFAHLGSEKMPPGYRVHDGALRIIPGHVRLPADLKIKPSQIFEAIESIGEGSSGLEVRIANRALAEYASSTGHTLDWLAERFAHHEKQAAKEAN